MIKIYEVSDPKFDSEVGIHLIDPFKAQIDSAIERATDMNYKTIWIHRSLGLSKSKRLVDTIKTKPMNKKQTFLKALEHELTEVTGSNTDAKEMIAEGRIVYRDGFWHHYYPDGLIERKDCYELYKDGSLILFDSKQRYNDTNKWINI